MGPSLEDIESGIENLEWDTNCSFHNYRANQLTTEVWNFNFFSGDLPKDSGTSEEALLYEIYVISVDDTLLCV